MKTAIAVAMGLVLVAQTAPALRADGQKFRETVTVKGPARHVPGTFILTFNMPVALPGVSLGAGTYVFRHMTQNAMQVTGKQGSPYGMFITIPDYRDEATNDYALVLGPGTQPDSPRRILSIFEPGETIGRRLLYADR